MIINMDVLDSLIVREVAFRIVLGDRFTAFDIVVAIRELIKSDEFDDYVWKEVQDTFNHPDCIFKRHNYVRALCRFKNGKAVRVFYSTEDDDVASAQQYIDSIDAQKKRDKTKQAVDSQECVDNLREDLDAICDYAAHVITTSRTGSLDELRDSIDDLKNVLSAIDGEDNV